MKESNASFLYGVDQKALVKISYNALVFCNLDEKTIIRNHIVKDSALNLVCHLE